MTYPGLAVATVSVVAFSGSATAQQAPADGPRVVEVTGFDYAFQAPDTIPSGWTTFRFHNQGSELHVFDLLRFPYDRTYGDLRREFFPAARPPLRSGSESGKTSGNLPTRTSTSPVSREGQRWIRW